VTEIVFAAGREIINSRVPGGPDEGTLVLCMNARSQMRNVKAHAK
jgi:hypothetical protein